MNRSESIEARTEELLKPLADANSLEIVDVEFVKEAGTWYLRAYMDKEGGITIGDCETVSRALSDILDREDYIEESYILEVSSPGLDRPLRKDKDLQRSIGEDVEVRTFKMVDGCKEFTGELVSFDKDTITIGTEDGEKVFERKNISLIRLAFDADI